MSFEVLVVTMGQTDFSKLEQMNIRSDVIFANQTDHTGKTEREFQGHMATMISTDTRGVGTNRNIALLYAKADICLFADDDVTYVDDMEQIVVSEFDAHPDADVMIFHLETDDPRRKQVKYQRTKKCGLLTRMPWGGVRIAVRLEAVKKANVWFTTLYGGGCVFPSGEDSMWLKAAKKAGLTFYVSSKTIGAVSFATSTWYSGRDEKYFYGSGAFCANVHPYTWRLWALYYAVRAGKTVCSMPLHERLKWIGNGTRGYREMLSFDAFKARYNL